MGHLNSRGYGGSGERTLLREPEVVCIRSEQGWNWQVEGREKQKQNGSQLTEF